MRDLHRERVEITDAIHREREAIMKDLHATTTQGVNDSWQHIRSTIHALFFWIVLIFIIVLGIPFVLGYIVGRTLKKKGQRPGVDLKVPVSLSVPATTTIAYLQESIPWHHWQSGRNMANTDNPPARSHLKGCNDLYIVTIYSLEQIP